MNRVRFTLPLAPAFALSLGVALSGIACSDSEPASGDASPVDGSAITDGPLAGDAGVDSAPATIALGDFVDFEADDKGVIVVDAPAQEGERHLLLLVARDYTALKSTKYAAKVAAGSGSAAMRSARAPFEAGRRCRFSQRLRQVLATAKGPLRAPAAHYLAAPVPPQLGDTRQFQVKDSGNQTQTITAEAIHVDEVAAFWIDRTTQPAATIADDVLADLANGFSKLVIPRERIYFGQESDVDNDGHVSVLLSPLVADSAVAYVSPCDLVEAGSVAGCDISNQGEILYLTPPNLLSGPYATATAMLETIAHEFQHAIYFYRKFILNQNAGTIENPYITEGMSALAQDLTGYQAGNFYVVMATLEQIDVVAVPNVTGDALKSYVPGDGDGIMRGAGYLLLRYLYDQAGGDEVDAQGTPIDKGGIAWLRAMIDQPEVNDASFTKAAGVPLSDLALQFWTAMALSNRGQGTGPLNDDARFNFLPTQNDPLTGRQRGTNLFTTFHGSALIGPAMQKVGAADRSLRSGGAELLELDKIAAGVERVVVALQTDPSAKAIARLIRIK